MYIKSISSTKELQKVCSSWRQFPQFREHCFKTIGAETTIRLQMTNSRTYFDLSPDGSVRTYNPPRPAAERKPAQVDNRRPVACIRGRWVTEPVPTPEHVAPQPAEPAVEAKPAAKKRGRPRKEKAAE